MKWKGAGSLDFCEPKQISACENSDCSILSSSSLYSLKDNPTVINSQGKINPLLTIQRSSAKNEYIYLEASNPNANPSPVKNTVKGLVVVCGKEKVNLIDQSNKVFNVKGVKSSLSPKLAFELKDIWELDITGLLQSKEDCPISKY